MEIEIKANIEIDIVLNTEIDIELSIELVLFFLFCFVCRTRDNFTFKCHRSVVSSAGDTQDIYPVSWRSLTITTA